MAFYFKSRIITKQNKTKKKKTLELVSSESMEYSMHWTFIFLKNGIEMIL